MSKDRDKIIFEIERVLASLNVKTDYKYQDVRRLRILEKKIKKFVKENTKIDKAILRIYRKFSPGIYFITVYAATKDFYKALAAYKLIELWGGYIQYEDLFYERGDTEFRKIAYEFKKQALKQLDNRIKDELVGADAVLEKYWRTELHYKKLMHLGHKFSDKEIKDFILLKAKSIICYPIIVKQYCSMPEELTNVINFNQAIYNFYDDYWDLKEDLQDEAPNTFILVLLEKTGIKKMQKRLRAQLITLIKKENVWRRLETIANRFRIKAERIRLSKEYHFWHFLPRYNYEFFEVYFE